MSIKQANSHSDSPAHQGAQGKRIYADSASLLVRRRIMRGSCGFIRRRLPLWILAPPTHKHGAQSAECACGGSFTQRGMRMRWRFHAARNAHAAAAQRSTECAGNTRPAQRDRIILQIGFPCAEKRSSYSVMILPAQRTGS